MLLLRLPSRSATVLSFYIMGVWSSVSSHRYAPQFWAMCHALAFVQVPLPLHRNVLMMRVLCGLGFTVRSADWRYTTWLSEVETKVVERGSCVGRRDLSVRRSDRLWA